MFTLCFLSMDTMCPAALLLPSCPPTTISCILYVDMSAYGHGGRHVEYFYTLCEYMSLGWV